MINRDIICIMCPLGCRIKAQIEGEEVVDIQGNKCKEGIKHAKQEVFSPGRVLTTTVKTDNPEAPLLPVRSDKLVPKERLMECTKIIAEHTAIGPVHLGQVIIDNILDLNINIIASRSTSP